MHEKLTELGINLKGKSSGTIKTLCPKCSHIRKKKRERCLSVNIDKGLYNCHNCGWGGTVSTIKHEKNYTIPEYNNTPLSDKMLKWFLDRGISKATIMRFGLTESERWMPEKVVEGKKYPGGNRTCVNFNYFRDEKLVNIKFRDALKCFAMNQGSELIFYGLDLIKDTEECIICEGEIDAMSFYESGIFNVVSVPNGASKGSQRLEYLDNCYEYFENKKRIYIATDNDEAGASLREELARRIGKERCWIFAYPEDCNDANEVLTHPDGGKDTLKEYFKYAYPYPLEGITELSQVEDRLNDIYYNGFPKGDRTGFYEFDKHLTFRPGEVTVVTGIPNGGKSEFMDQVMMKLSESESKWRWGIFSAENQPVELHIAKLCEKLIGKPFYIQNIEEKMTPEELHSAKRFINDHFFFVDICDENMTLEALLEKAKQLLIRKGINGFLIDPWNYIEHKIPYGYTETQYISEALTKISRFSKANVIHIFIVAHPTKIKKNKDSGAYEVPTLYDIAGSANWFNKSDNGISIYRDYNKGTTTAHIQKVRFKFIGKVGSVTFTWDSKSGRYYPYESNYMDSFEKKEYTPF